MEEKSENEIQEALLEVLRVYGIEVDFSQKLPDEEEGKEERYGDYAAIISKTQDKIDDLSEEADRVLQSTGMTREELESYGSNPNNFTNEQWEAIQNMREACESFKRRALQAIGEEQFNTTLEKAEKRERKKAPGRFAKKKQWIPL